jgi:hypothetical protein
MRPFMRLFGKNRVRHPGSDGDHRHHTYRFRVETRAALIEKFDLISLRRDHSDVGDRDKLARVLEEVSAEGWRLVGVSGDEFFFRHRH